LDHVAEMQQDEFSKTFSKSPVKRTKLSGLRRNAAVVLAARHAAGEQREP
jgi:epoxyqueuosine reductase QueG